MEIHHRRAAGSTESSLTLNDLSYDGEDGLSINSTLMGRTNEITDVEKYVTPAVAEVATYPALLPLPKHTNTQTLHGHALTH